MERINGRTNNYQRENRPPTVLTLPGNSQTGDSLYRIPAVDYLNYVVCNDTKVLEARHD